MICELLTGMGIVVLGLSIILGNTVDKGENSVQNNCPVIITVQ